MGRVLTDEQRLLRTVSERSWQAQVEQTLALCGFDRVYHTFDSRRSRAGFPDIVATRIRPDGWTMLFVELKSEVGKLSDEQRQWLADLSTIAALVNRGEGWVRMIVDIWRPSDAARLWDLLQE